MYKVLRYKLFQKILRKRKISKFKLDKQVIVYIYIYIYQFILTASHFSPDSPANAASVPGSEQNEGGRRTGDHLEPHQTKLCRWVNVKGGLGPNQLDVSIYAIMTTIKGLTTMQVYCASSDNTISYCIVNCHHVLPRHTYLSHECCWSLSD